MRVGKGKKGIGVGSPGLFIVFLTAIYLMACAAAVPIIYYPTKSGFVATAQIDRPAEEVWKAAVRNAEKQPNLEISERDDENLSLKAEELGTENTGGIKVTPIDERRSQLVVRGDSPGNKEADRRLGVRIVEDICTELGMEYKLIEG